MEIKILKGTHQIGGCITVIKTRTTKIIVDFGEDLTEEGKNAFEKSELLKEVSDADAVFITHSHLDHVGLVNIIPKNVPIYMEKNTKTILDIGSDFGINEPLSREVDTFELSKKTNPIFVGDLKITPHIVDHSSYNSCMFVIEGEGKKVLHTGDYRNHGRKGKLFSSTLDAIGKVDCLITEGTTLLRHNNVHYKSELELEKEAKKIMSKYDQVFVLSSSTNLDRLVTFYKAKRNKKFVIDTFTAAITKAVDFPVTPKNEDIYQWTPSIYFKIKTEKFKKKYMNSEGNYDFLPNYVMLIKQSMLIDLKKLKKAGLVQNACLIYSMWSGYIEKEKGLSSMLDEIEKMGIKIYELHTSGHADLDAMKLMNSKLTPQKTVIIHTENSENCQKIFDNVINIDDGENILL